MESELFGYVKGAFTGANRAKDGLLASPRGARSFSTRLASCRLICKPNCCAPCRKRRCVRSARRIASPSTSVFLAATNRDLAGMVEQGRFRKDLYYRLSVVNLRIPPLRERKQDIPLLARHSSIGWRAKPALRTP